ncbi:unnamed protein product [Durusdinium trenchii]|uniref:Uncharacterized protein n=1 Tax=Durusdinium trenchii TaxID=1381693 RepID=A0ABP0KSI1_9DINO
MESVLQKSCKIRSLVSDLQRNYICDTARKSAECLKSDLGDLDKLYTELTDTLANGEAEDFPQSYLA